MSRPTDTTRAGVAGSRRLRLIEARTPDRPRAPRALTSERFVQTIDGQVVVVGRRRWRICVCGVHVDAAVRWVQVSLVGQRDHALTLRLAVHENGARALQMIAEWLSRPIVAGDQIITVV